MGLFTLILLVALTVMQIMYWKKTGQTWALVTGTITGVVGAGVLLFWGYVILALMFAFG